jgi:type I site-specific restriction-modification system R (restriction) subunit
MRTHRPAEHSQEGCGQRYLIQHSAGSGKTNYDHLADHRLARSYDSSDQVIFMASLSS